MATIVLVLGGGDLASGVAYRLHRVGLRVAMTELPQPLAVRRLVSFAEAIYTGECTIEGITAKKAPDFSDTLRILRIFANGQIPVMIDPQADSRHALHPAIIIDARMKKSAPELGRHEATLFIGLGPGFNAGVNCHAAIETNRGHNMGRVIWQGATEPDSSVPEKVQDYGLERVLRAPEDGYVESKVQIGDIVESGQILAEVGGQTVQAPFAGVVRGLIHPSLRVERGFKIGDIDPRGDPRLCLQISDKSLAVGGGVLEAILSRPNLRPQLWS